MRKKQKLFLLTLFFLCGCSLSHSVRSVPEPSRCKEPMDSGWCTGTASWYGKDFHGRKTSSGEVYNMYALTAAHRTLPLGTLIRVVSVDNEKSVIVKVNDRGPFIAGRILDLSYGAALALDMVQKGTAEIKFKIDQAPAIDEKGFYTVQAGAFAIKENAVLFQQKIQKRFQRSVRLIPFESPEGVLYRVRLGQFQKMDDAEKVASLLEKENGVTPFVLREDQFP